MGFPTKLLPLSFLSVKKEKDEFEEMYTARLLHNKNQLFFNCSKKKFLFFLRRGFGLLKIRKKQH